MRLARRMTSRRIPADSAARSLASTRRCTWSRWSEWCTTWNRAATASVARRIRRLRTKTPSGGAGESGGSWDSRSSPPSPASPARASGGAPKSAPCAPVAPTAPSLSLCFDGGFGPRESSSNTPRAMRATSSLLNDGTDGSARSVTWIGWRSSTRARLRCATDRLRRCGGRGRRRFRREPNGSAGCSFVDARVHRNGTRGAAPPEAFEASASREVSCMRACSVCRVRLLATGCTSGLERMDTSVAKRNGAHRPRGSLSGTIAPSRGARRRASRAGDSAPPERAALPRPLAVSSKASASGRTDSCEARRGEEATLAALSPPRGWSRDARLPGRRRAGVTSAKRLWSRFRAHTRAGARAARGDSAGR